jgi:signal peptide peptidase SppA
MKIIDIVNGHWAIEPVMLNEIRGIYATHLRGDKISIPDIEASLGRPLGSQPQGYDIIDGVAVVPVMGVTAKKMNLFSNISGGASTEMIARDIQQAANDPAVNSILLHIDSPGGTVDGTMALADIVAACKSKKPMAALADGTMCSAAYWIGSATGEVFMADATTRVGSIGVVTGHIDISGWEDKQGIKTTEVTAGKYKRIHSSHAPLSDEGKDILQADADYIYSLFVDAVAAARGVGADTVLQNMADGRVFTGQAAINAGLVDGVATLPQMIERMKTKQPLTGSVTSSTTLNTEENIMNIEDLKTKHPDIYQAAVAEGQTAGATAERTRTSAIKANALPGHEALVEQCITEGISAEASAGRILAAENARLSAAAADFSAGGAPSLPASESGDVTAEATQRNSMIAAAVAAANTNR